MSDLASLVAAALRDKVVLELQDEIAKLKEENDRLRRSDDVHGRVGDGSLYVAIMETGTDIDLLVEDDIGDERVFASGVRNSDHTCTLNTRPCTLQDLRNATVIFNSYRRNGRSEIPWAEYHVHLCINVDMGAYSKPPKTWNEVFPYHNCNGCDDDFPASYAGFFVTNFMIMNSLQMYFELPDIPKERLFDLFGMDGAAFLANPHNLGEFSDRLTPDFLIETFGADTNVAMHIGEF